MNFRQKEDGSCDINFEDNEIDIIVEVMKRHDKAWRLEYVGKV